MPKNQQSLTRELGWRLLSKLREIRKFHERLIPIYPTDVLEKLCYPNPATIAARVKSILHEP